MRASAILTVLGCDQPGLTQSIAEALAQVGGNWLESHLSHLRGMYVGSVLVELPDGKIDELRKAMARIDTMALDVRVLEVGSDREREGSTMMLELVAQDRLGIVREVTSALASIGVNIESFESSAENSSWSGARLFRATAELMLQPGVTENDVRGALEDISGEIMVDLDPAQPSGHMPRIDAA
jgi:glycine cleavage system regulatory protein